jgi:hypothetical protein
MHIRTGQDVDHFTERATMFHKTTPNVTVNLDAIAPT